MGIDHRRKQFLNRHFNPKTSGAGGGLFVFKTRFHPRQKPFLVKRLQDYPVSSNVCCLRDAGGTAEVSAAAGDRENLYPRLRLFQSTDNVETGYIRHMNVRYHQIKVE